MSQKTRVDLNIQADTIKNETITDANTELRVGQMLNDIIDSARNVLDEPASFSTLNDKDSVPQEATIVASVSGAVVFDMVKQIQKVTITGDITSVAFTNEPSATDNGTWIIDLYQDATGEFTMDWTGSGVHGGEGEVVAGL